MPSFYIHICIQTTKKIKFYFSQCCLFVLFFQLFQKPVLFSFFYRKQAQKKIFFKNMQNYYPNLLSLNFVKKNSLSKCCVCVLNAFVFFFVIFFYLFLISVLHLSPFVLCCCYYNWRALLLLYCLHLKILKTT